MSAGKLNITIEQGATFTRKISMTDATGAAVNLTGATVAAKLSPGFGAATSYPFTMTVTDGPNGRISWVMPNTVTVGLNGATKARWVYDIEVTYPSGNVDRILQGEATIEPGVTK